MGQSIFQASLQWKSRVKSKSPSNTRSSHMGLLVVGKDGGGVLAAVGAVDGHGIVGLPLAGLGLLGAEGVQDVKNLAAL